jgi:type II secretory pathway pseudopilin PulG
MRHGLKLRNYKITKLQNPQRPQRGYMMITLMLALALITIGLLTVLPKLSQQIRRDREEELRHRGTAYMRAIQHFYKRLGRYPMRVEELENTNNLRFLRKRYKDPVNRDRATGQEKDFKFLHQTDISLNNGPVLGQIPGQAPGQGALGGVQGGPQAAALGALAAQPGGVQQTATAAAQTPATGDSSNSNAEGNPNSPESSPSNSISSSGSSSGFNGPVLGGGPILGVASASKEKTIRVFYEKTHYNDWLFIYVPGADRGGLLTGPVNPNMPTATPGPPPGQGPPPNAGPSPTPPPTPPSAPPPPDSGQTPPQ